MDKWTLGASVHAEDKRFANAENTMELGAFATVDTRITYQATPEFSIQTKLTNMFDKEIDKMIKYKISPVNISVHTTNSELRIKMLGNRFAGDILDKMKRLKVADITMNAQIVLVKGINDEAELEKTVNDLEKLYQAGHFNNE